MTLVDATIGECVDASLDEGSRDAASSMTLRDSDVLEIATAPIGAAERRSDDRATIDGDEAQSMMLNQISGERLALIGVPHRDAVRRSPECDHGIIVVWNELAYLDHSFGACMRRICAIRSDAARSDPWRPF
jgi:hypothetical protein